MNICAFQYFLSAVFFSEYYKEMADRGVFLPPSQFEGLFLSTEHTEMDIEKTLTAMDESFAVLTQ